MIPRFSPAFDNGTALLHEIVEGKLGKFSDPFARRAYINRGRHHIRLRLDEAKGVRHIELIGHLLATRPQLMPFVKSVTSFDFEVLAGEIMQLSAIPSPVPISAQRCEAICSILGDRLTELRSLTSD